MHLPFFLLFRFGSAIEGVPLIIGTWKNDKTAYVKILRFKPTYRFQKVGINL